MKNIVLTYLEKELIEFAHGRSWDKLIVNYEIFNRGTHATKYILAFNGEEDDEYYDISTETGLKSMEELLALRDQILQETGKRIWGAYFYPLS